jgi:hypothetical protein
MANQAGPVRKKPTQVENLVDKVLGHMDSYQAGSQAQSILLAGDPGIGKAQNLSAKIKTPTGWTTMGEIKLGDLVSTPDGKSAIVIGLYPQGDKDIYTLTFHDGSSTTCCIILNIQLEKHKKISFQQRI